MDSPTSESATVTDREPATLMSGVPSRRLARSQSLHQHGSCAIIGDKTSSQRNLPFAYPARRKAAGLKHVQLISEARAIASDRDDNRNTPTPRQVPLSISVTRAQPQATRAATRETVALRSASLLRSGSGCRQQVLVSQVRGRKPSQARQPLLPHDPATSFTSPAMMVR